MAGYRFTNKAVEDLTEIWNYTLKKWSENQADIYYSMIINFCKELVTNPNLGKDYSMVSKFVSGVRAGRHIIFYRELENGDIEILRILHEQMDLKNKLY